MLTVLEFCKLEKPFTERHNSDYGDKLYLYEQNYGALEKDDRLYYISDKIKTEIVKSLENDNFTDNIILKTYTKYKENNNVTLTVNWAIHTTRVPQRHHSICQEVYTGNTNDPLKFALVFYCQQEQKQSSVSYKRDLIKYFESDNSDIEIFHEAKHILDHIDNLYPNTPYVKPEDNVKKYVSQRRELHNFIISIIRELEFIRKQNPTISYFNAISQSEMYKAVMGKLSPKLQNKVKTKLSYYWISGEPSMNPIQDY
jgi:hypothetical protein